MHKKLAYYGLIGKTATLFPLVYGLATENLVQQLHIIFQRSKEMVKLLSHSNHMFICFSEEQIQNTFDLT